MSTIITKFSDARTEHGRSKGPFILLFLSAMFLVLHSCMGPEKKIIQVDPAFATYISAYTSGVVSCTTDVRIQLAEQLKDVKPADLEKLFEFEPSVKGTIRLLDERTVVFTPDKPLDSKETYTCEFRIGKLVKVPSKYKEFRFQFTTMEQHMSVEHYNTYSFDSYNYEIQRVRCRIITSDYADTAALKKTVTATQDGQSLPIEWDSYYDNRLYFTINKVERKIKPSKVIISWNGEAIGDDNYGTVEVPLAALGDFTITNNKLVQDPDQRIELNFSDPIHPKQNLNGIITIKGVDNLSYEINENTVTVYIPNRIVGSKVLTVSSGLKNFKGYKMLNEQKLEFNFEEPKPLIRLLSKGNILPNSNGLLFPFEVIGMRAVDIRISRIFENNVTQFLQVNDMNGEKQLKRVSKKLVEKKLELDKEKKMKLNQWNRFAIDLAKYINVEPGAIYRVEIRMRPEYTTCNCNTTKDYNPTFDSDPEWSDENTYEYDYYDNDYDEYESDYYDNASPCENEYYRGKAKGRNILASDLGIIAKIGDDHIAHVFINNLVNTLPIAGTSVEFLNYQKQVLGSGITDANGMVSVPLKTKPFLLVAKYGKQRGYMKMEDSQSNSLSKFDVSGEEVQKGIKGFVYGERGVWRPGDSIYVSFILEDKQKKLPTNHPVTFELVNPHDEVVHKIVKTKSLNGMYAFRTATDANAPTGNWYARVNVGNRVFTRPLKVETIKPNRLKIYLDFGADVLTNVKDIKGKLGVKWLHGAVAKSLESKIEVTLAPTETRFPKYPGFVFDSPLKSYRSEQITVFDGKVNDKGEAVFPMNMVLSDNAPGMLKAYFTTRVFEEGGDYSIDRSSVSVSPFSSYVGIRTPESRLYGGMLETGKRHEMDIATVDANGKPVSRKIEVKVYNIGWRWWWDHSDDDVATYLARTSAIAIMDSSVKTVNGKGTFSLKLENSRWGRYLIVVSDPVSGHTSGKVVYVDAPWWSKSNNKENENATMLNFATDKDKYLTGETMKVTIPSSADNKLLVCIESGTKVLQKFWVNTTSGETHLEIPVVKEMTPNCYVHVTLMQPHTKQKLDLPIRLYGVVPVMVENPQTHLHPVIAFPEVIKPESNVNVTVSEKDGKPMTYTLAMVDEGLLDLTGYRTPDPWSTFNAREALGVKTWDLYDMVMSSQFGKIDKILSIGGDGSGEDGKSVKANRFKPVVKFIGPFHMNAGETKTHKLEIPNYVGSVKVMVVAGENGSYGCGEKTAFVRKPLMVLATLPRVVGPTETVYLPVNVFAMENHVKNVHLEVVTDKMITVDGNKTQDITFDAIGDEVVNFKLLISGKTGISKIKVIATSGKEKAVSEIEIDIRTPNPEVVDVEQIVLEPGKSWNLDYDFAWLEGTNKGTVEVSSIPPMNLEKRLGYLIQYPHGCIEQTTSSVFPQLALNNIMELNGKDKARISNNIKAGIKRLMLFQTNAGGFSYWPGESESSEWGSNYAGHFMVEAEKLGYAVPELMKSRWIKYQQNQSKNWTGTTGNYSHPHGSESNQLIQAYRLYTLALVQSPEIGSMNRLREMPNLAPEAKWRLAAAYQLIGQPEVAKDLVKGLTANVKPYKELTYTYGSDVRDKAMILETMSLMSDRLKAADLAKELAGTLSSDAWLSTQETGYCLIAMNRYVTGLGNTKVMSVTVSANGGEQIVKSTSSPVCQIRLQEKDLVKNGKLTVTNAGGGVVFVKFVKRGVPLVGDRSYSAKNLGMKIRYTDLKGKDIDPTKLVQGTDFIAEVTINNTGAKGNLSEMALNQLFPCGWEIHNNRMDGMVNSNLNCDPSTYQDIRDDRIYTYFNIGVNKTKTYKVLLNATYLGRFYLPTVECEAMYDNTIYARVPGKWVEVVKDGGNVVGK